MTPDVALEILRELRRRVLAQPVVLRDPKCAIGELVPSLAADPDVVGRQRRHRPHVEVQVGPAHRAHDAQPQSVRQVNGRPVCASRPLHLPQPLAEAAAAAQHIVNVQGGDADVVVRGEGLDDGVRPAHVGGGEGQVDLVVVVVHRHALHCTRHLGVDGGGACRLQEEDVLGRRRRRELGQPDGEGRRPQLRETRRRPPPHLAQPALSAHHGVDGEAVAVVSHDGREARGRLGACK